MSLKMSISQPWQNVTVLLGLFISWTGKMNLFLILVFQLLLPLYLNSPKLKSVVSVWYRSKVLAR